MHATVGGYATTKPPKKGRQNLQKDQLNSSGRKNQNQYNDYDSHQRTYSDAMTTATVKK